MDSSVGIVAFGGGLASHQAVEVVRQERFLGDSAFQNHRKEWRLHREGGQGIFPGAVVLGSDIVACSWTGIRMRDSVNLQIKVRIVIIC